MFFRSTSRDLVIACGSMHWQEEQHPPNVVSTQSASLRQASETGPALVWLGEGVGATVVVEACSTPTAALGACGGEGPGSLLHAPSTRRAESTIGADTRMARR